MNGYGRNRGTVSSIILSVLFILAAGCATNTGQQAGKTAGIGAIAGAAGGALSAAIFGGNVGEAMARGAAWGAGSGAVGGAIAGSQMDEAAASTPEAKAAKLKKDIGDDAFNGLTAIVDCDYTAALADAEKAKASSNNEYAVAGLWVEALVYFDSREEAKARALYPEIFKQDKHVSTEKQAEEHIRKGLDQIMQTREKRNKPRICQ
ncbi:MAG: hypothetical protein ABIL58_14840 [Pseudomonadota bacterium]